MNPEQRMQLQIARTQQYGDIMRTTIFGQVAIAALIGFGVQGVGIPLIVAIIAVTAFGALGGAAALDDIANLRVDMDDVTAKSHYGKVAKARNLGLLKTLTTVLVGLTGLAEIAAILMM